ncbi:PEP-CTERM sorting domain-containing protein [Duganella sp. CY15W]|uniref:PEP-CTERM sorting domain-containing protein n=1 Tax=Duganella sp. CY15W TaxID=2692172 RepID=UPI00136F987F|nr:PEP-CTERM sorting domain-containing protein [Duganella sp. CY15W]MYM29243.1 PEP-CTERM sorting domain-containing protein [Duganella sp. CY15W]
MLSPFIVRSTMLATLLLAGAGAQAAAVSGSASITNLQYHVVDLTPDDGVAASVTYWGMSWTQSRAYARVDQLLDADVNDHVRLGVLAPPAYASLQGGYASATMTPQALSNLADNRNTALLPEAGNAREVSASAGSSYAAEFFVAPHSQLVITGHAAADLLFQPQKDMEGHAYLDFHAGFGYQNNFSYWGYHDDADTSHFVISEDFTLIYTNNTDYTYMPTFSSGISLDLSNTSTVPLPVPEPSSYAMMAAGLLLLGWRQRGRKRG